MNKNFKKAIALILSVSALTASFSVFAVDDNEIILDNPNTYQDFDTEMQTELFEDEYTTVELSEANTYLEPGSSGQCGDNLTWTFDDTGTLTISGAGNMYNYYFNSPFYEKTNIKRLVINDGVTSIGNTAFSGCSGLTDVLVIPDSVTLIESHAFYGCSGLTCDLVIPDSVTSIGKSAFENCSNLTSINVSEENQYYSSEDGVLFNKDRTKLICFPGGKNGTYVIPDNVISIEDYAFSGCSGLTGDLIIPDSVTSIGYSAFFGCSGLTGDLIIPDSVTSVEACAFYGCSGLTGNLVISASITLIEARTFYNCSGLTGNLIIPDNVTSIDLEAFYNCSRLNGNLVIPDSVTFIGDGAFYGCSGFIGNLVIPDSVTSIEKRAFLNCTNLTDMYISRSEDSLEIGNFPNRVHWKYDLSKCTAAIKDFTCTGDAIVPTEKDITVTSPNGKTLYYGTDYIIESANNNVNVGTATAHIVSPEGGISIMNQDVPFNIVGIDLSGAEVTFPDNITWDGAAVEPEPTVVVNGKTLVKGTDYTITYSNNTFTIADFPTKDTVNTATATITGIGSYIGSLSKKFEVKGFDPRNGVDSVDIERELSVSATIDGTFVYNGAEHKPVPKLVYHFVNPTTNVAIDYEMVEGEDFKIVSYSNNVNAGTAKIVVEGIGTFENTRTIIFNISPCELSVATIADIPSYEYCKVDICPDVEIKVGDTVMTNGVDYDLSYENNRNRGTATVTITGKGNLTGVTTKTFEITPRDGSKFVYIIWL